MQNLNVVGISKTPPARENLTDMYPVSVIYSLGHVVHELIFDHGNSIFSTFALS